MSEVKLWERPASVPIPTVWVRYESPKPMPNGRRPRFRIQDYTDEWRDHLMRNMVDFFLRDEVISKSIGVSGDPTAVNEFKEFIAQFLDRKMVLVAIVENLDELGDESLPAFAGCNVTVVVTEDDPHAEGKCPKLRKIFRVLGILEGKMNSFKHYQTSEYMYAFGLSVNPAFRGHNLGHEILKARFPLCKAVGVNVTVTVFTGAAAQRSAEKAGFETLAELRYDEYKDENGRIVFNVSEPKSMKLMGLRIP